MKFMKKLLLTLVFISLVLHSFAQIPQKISYQSIIRNSTNQPIANQQIKTRITLSHIDSTNSIDSTLYIETHLTKTNSVGLVNIVIGMGISSYGKFSSIDWSTGKIFIKSETDPDGGNNFKLSHTSELLSVPFALCAGSTLNQSKMLFVTSFGAKGNTINDDSDAFLKAIDSAKKIGAKIYVPAGNYRTTKTIEIPGGITLIGEGIGNTPLQSPFTGSNIRYEGNGVAIKMTEHATSIRDLAIVDNSQNKAQGGILIEANNRLCESNILSNVLIYGFTNGTAITLSSINNGGIAYCSFYDIRIRHAKIGIHITQDATSFTNSNTFFHGAISGGGFDYGILVDNGNNNTFYGTIIEPQTSTYGHLFILKGEVQCDNIRIEGSKQSKNIPLIYFESGTMNSVVTGTYGGGLTIDKGNNSILMRSSKSLGFSNTIENQFLNSTFSGASSSNIPEWTITGTGVTFSILAPVLTETHNVLKITIPAGISCYLKPGESARPSIMNATIYQQLSFGCNIKTSVPNSVFAICNSPTGIVTSTPYSGSGQWEFMGMKVLIDSSAILDAKFLITNNNGSPIDVYITTPTLVFGNQSPSINPKPLATSGGSIYGLLSLSLDSASTPTNGYLTLTKDANYFTICNTNTIYRINHLLADRFPRGSVITLLFKNSGVNVTTSAYLTLKTGFTSIANSSLSLISNGDGTWLEVQRNN